MTKLNAARIKWLIRQVVKYQKKPSDVAPVYEISPRRVRQLVQSFRETGEMPVLKKNRRPRTELSEDEKQLVLRAVQESKLSGAVTVRLYIKKQYGKLIPRNKLQPECLIGLFWRWNG